MTTPDETARSGKRAAVAWSVVLVGALLLWLSSPVLLDVWRALFAAVPNGDSKLPGTFWTFAETYLEPLATALAFGAAVYAGFGLRAQLRRQDEQFKALKEDVATGQKTLALQRTQTLNEHIKTIREAKRLALAAMDYIDEIIVAIEFKSWTEIPEYIDDEFDVKWNRAVDGILVHLVDDHKMQYWIVEIHRTKARFATWAVRGEAYVKNPTPRRRFLADKAMERAKDAAIVAERRGREMVRTLEEEEARAIRVLRRDHALNLE